jgi:hypothetical protein
MWLNRKTQAGSSVAFAKNPCYTILVVSPTVHRGMVDCKFRARAILTVGKCKEYNRKTQTTTVEKEATHEKTVSEHRGKD